MKFDYYERFDYHDCLGKSIERDISAIHVVKFDNEELKWKILIVKAKDFKDHVLDNIFLSLEYPYYYTYFEDAEKKVKELQIKTDNAIKDKSRSTVFKIPEKPNIKDHDYMDAFKKVIIERENKIPIYKGCSNGMCFCTGACREIIGYRG